MSARRHTVTRHPHQPRALFALTGMVALTGCVQTNATLLGPQTAQRPALSPSVVRIYRTAAQVPGKYEEVALINATESSTDLSEARLFNAMRKKAADVGANAIILDAITEPSPGVKVAGAFLGTGTERKGRAVAIYLFAPPAAVDTTKP